MRKIVIASLAALAVLIGGTNATAGAQTETQNIVQIAQGNPDLSTLVQAVTAADLAGTLSGPGPFTVFAPTNAAFAALPAGTLDSLLADPKGALTDILKLHVISGSVDAAAATAAAGTNVDTLGGPVAVALNGSSLTVGGAKVVTADIKASNGIIHVIDAVITKPATAATPSAVNSGDSGLAASTTSTGLALAIIAGFAALAFGGSTVAFARARRRS